MFQQAGDTASYGHPDVGAPDVAGAVIAAVIDLGSRRGYHGTSLDAVASVAGISIRQVRRRFPTKANLFAAALVTCVDGLVGDHGTRVDIEESTAGTAATPAGADIDAIVANRRLVVVVDVLNSARRDPDLAAALDDRRGEIGRTLATLLDALGAAPDAGTEVSGALDRAVATILGRALLRPTTAARPPT